MLTGPLCSLEFHTRPTPCVNGVKVGKGGVMAANVVNMWPNKIMCLFVLSSTLCLEHPVELCLVHIHVDVHNREGIKMVCDHWSSLVAVVRSPICVEHPVFDLTRTVCFKYLRNPRPPSLEI